MTKETACVVKASSLNDRCAEIHDIVGSVVRILREVVGGGPEPQEERPTPDGTLAVVELKLDDLDYTARKALELAEEVQKRV